ncbi:hypothetical protein ACFTXM_49175 [Streptomyces sp. NPDC056930]|uniref:hypothetical protein n=1 Tax=Streptomyces sp. NPDC056930 TaxID=3345967 RepID=UPI00363706E7
MPHQWVRTHVGIGQLVGQATAAGAKRDERLRRTEGMYPGIGHTVGHGSDVVGLPIGHQTVGHGSLDAVSAHSAAHSASRR